MLNSVMHQRLIRILLLSLAYFAAGWLGLKIPFTGSHITLVWLPAGIAVAALLRWGSAIWPGIFMGAFLVNLSIGSTVTLAVGIAMGSTLGSLLASGWLRRVGFQTSFHQKRDVSMLIVAACLGMALSASIGVTSLYLADIMPLRDTGPAWLTWWMGDVVGVLLAAPLILTLNRINLAQLAHVPREVLIWILVATPLAWFAFIHEYSYLGGALPLAFLTLPLVAGAALRFGITGASLSGLGFSVVAALGLFTGKGTFSLEDEQISLFLLWAYMITTAITGLLVTVLQTEQRQVEHTLKESEEKLRGLFNLSPLGIALTDMKGHFLEFNDSFLRICGYTSEEVKALDYWALTPKKYEADEAKQLESLERTGVYGPYEKEYVRKEGNAIPLQLNGMLVTGKDGQHYIWSIIEDISERKQMVADLRIAAIAFESQVGIMVTDANGVILRINRAFSEDSGYTEEELVGQTPRLLKSGHHDENFYAEMWNSIRHTGVWQGEIWDRRKNGEVYPKWMTITSLKGEDGVVTHYVSTQIDITERKTAEDEIRSLAFYDPLTQLPNRRLLLDRLQQALASSDRDHGQGALLFIDLDNFKLLNDTLGHDKGDVLLQQVAQRLSSAIRERDTVARLGGDEFVIMLLNVNTQFADVADQVEIIGEKILNLLNQPFLLDSHEFQSTASIGITLFGTNDETIDNLLKQADLAMYQAKEAGRNTLRFFDPEMQVVVDAHMSLVKELRRAIRKDQLVLHYQPQVDSDSNCMGAEALVRWKHPKQGIIFPDEFIPAAEELGLITELGKWVLESACKQLAAWSTKPFTNHLCLAVNVSIQQLRQQDFVEQVQSILDRTGADPTKLKLEITESSLLIDTEDVIAKMMMLKSKGIGFALDDFGTGYSSLTYLKSLPLEKLKIDRSFVLDVMTDPNDASIVKTIVALAQSLDLAVIAEGVETEEQREFLARAGCHDYQGYLYSQPIPPDKFELFLTQR
ncbi:PAS S-box/diguanylate cyclase domain-containing protein [Solemya velum gill symbiont]|uniref:cyclic-guanylate-specific phosphodiesterase n=2 Tax=Solemya velum gill symbiont TaxID=2340 RepID=A0A0B0HBA4_SOVGS|nr:PAS S-box/diguanylate cyclase domain-containing protein [Solemya velum gill symbiont]